MPYDKDGETWDADYKFHCEGMAENQPGHKKLDEYSLPKWAKHPMMHPKTGVYIEPKDYAYSCVSGALDGQENFHGWGPAHVACMYGDMEMLKSCSEAELSAQTANGETPAWYAVRYGFPWCLQWLAEHGADVTTASLEGYTPEQLIRVNSRNDNAEIEWLELALNGELTDKKYKLAQEYKLKKGRAEGLTPFAEALLDKDKLKQRWHEYKAGDYELPYDLPTQEESLAKKDLPRSAIPRPPAKSQPVLPVALLFPGQGSQYVGMMKDCVSLPAVKEMLATAEKVLGWDLKEVCLKGPESKLSETKYCQPAMFVAGMAALEVMRQTRRDSVERPQAVAGLSLGEYTACCAAGVLSFEDALQLVKLRAEAMQSATEKVPQCMVSIAGLDRATLERLCEEAKAAEAGAVCQIANVLFPAGFTCAGNKAAIDKLAELATSAGALQTRIVKAGGAFHTPLMKPAQEDLNKAIDKMLPRMKPPRCAIYFNATAQKVSAGTLPPDFVDLLKRQMTSEVLWEPSIKQMIMDQVKEFYECGPLKQLKSMIKRIDPEAFKKTENISV